MVEVVARPRPLGGPGAVAPEAGLCHGYIDVMMMYGTLGVGGRRS